MIIQSINKLGCIVIAGCSAVSQLCFQFVPVVLENMMVVNYDRCLQQTVWVEIFVSNKIDFVFVYIPTV